MIITVTSNNSVLIKTKTEQIQLNSNVSIGSFVVPMAGEYDIAGIQCEALHLTEGSVYFFTTEDLHITYLTQANSEVTTIDDASSTDILIIDTRSNDKAETIKPLLKSLEPSYLVLVGEGVTDQLISELHLPPYAESNLKVTRNSLPQEGTLLLTGK